MESGPPATVQPERQPDEMIPVYRLNNNGMGGPTESTIEGILESVRIELEAYADPDFGGRDQVTLTITASMMKRSDYDALPEFEGY